jgi:SAM-dependent methyltransferase
MAQLFGWFQRVVSRGLATFEPDYTGLSARFYDAVQPWSDDIGFYEGLLRERPGPVLELGCGNGRLLLPLLAAGRRVVGLDRSADMLAELVAAARRKDHSVEAVRADMRDFAFRPAFGLVICALNTFQHLTAAEDRLRTLIGVRRSLAPGGAFALDVSLADFEESGGPQLSIFTDPRDGTRNLASVLSTQRTGDRLVFNVLNLARAGEEERRLAVSCWEEWAFDREVFLAECAQAGLVLRREYRDYERRPWRQGDRDWVGVLEAA